MAVEMETLKLEDLYHALKLARHFTFRMSGGPPNLWELLMISGLVAGHVCRIETLVDRAGFHSSKAEWEISDKASWPAPNVCDSWAAASLVHVSLNGTEKQSFRLMNVLDDKYNRFHRRVMHVVADEAVVSLFRTYEPLEPEGSVIMGLEEADMPPVRNGTFSINDKLNAAALNAAYGGTPVLHEGRLLLRNPT